MTRYIYAFLVGLWFIVSASAMMANFDGRISNRLCDLLILLPGIALIVSFAFLAATE